MPQASRQSSFRGLYENVTGDHLICAVPLPCRKTSRSSRLSLSRSRGQSSRLPYLSVSKIFLQSGRRFWLDRRESGFATTANAAGQPDVDATHQRRAPGASCRPRRSPALPPMTAMSEQERIAFAVEQVDTVYPGMREHFEGGVTKCWDEDGLGAGAPLRTSRARRVGHPLAHVARTRRQGPLRGDHRLPVWIHGG